MHEIKIAYSLFKVLIKDSLHYPAKLLMHTVILLARGGILLSLYWYVFKLNNDSIRNVNFQEIAWSIFFYFSFMLLRFRDVSKAIMDDVKYGNVEVLFCKPMSYISYRVWWQLWSNIFYFSVITLVSLPILISIVGIPDTLQHIWFLPTFIGIFIGCTILSLLIYVIIGLLAFWIEDVHPIHWIIDKSIMMLGGSYLPIALFPPTMLAIAKYSPFGASQFITHTVSKTWQTDWLQLMGIQWSWICILGIVVYFMFKQVQHKISVNGG